MVFVVVHIDVVVAVVIVVLWQLTSWLFVVLLLLRKIFALVLNLRCYY